MPKARAKVFRADLYGLREGKYRALWENDVSTTEWEEVAPQTPFYLFAKRDKDTAREYEQGWKLSELAPVNVLGFQSHRDKFALDFEKDKLERKIQRLLNNSENTESLRQEFGLEGV